MAVFGIATSSPAINNTTHYTAQEMQVERNITTAPCLPWYFADEITIAIKQVLKEDCPQVEKPVAKLKPSTRPRPYRKEVENIYGKSHWCNHVYAECKIGVLASSDNWLCPSCATIESSPTFWRDVQSLEDDECRICHATRFPIAQRYAGIRLYTKRIRFVSKTDENRVTIKDEKGIDCLWVCYPTEYEGRELEREEHERERLRNFDRMMASLGYRYWWRRQWWRQSTSVCALLLDTQRVLVPN